MDPLPDERHRTEVRRQQRLEFVAIELPDVEGILVPGHIRILAAIRTRNDEQSGRREHTADLAHHLVVPIVMLESFEADDHVHRLGGQWNVRAAPRDEREVRAPVSSVGVLDDARDDVYADDLRRGAGQQVGTVTFTARNVEDALALNQLAGEEVAMDVLKPDITLQFG